MYCGHYLFSISEKENTTFCTQNAFTVTVSLLFDDNMYL